MVQIYLLCLPSWHRRGDLLLLLILVCPLVDLDNNNNSNNIFLLLFMNQGLRLRPRGGDGADDVAAAGELGGEDQPAPLEHGHAAAGQPPTHGATVLAEGGERVLRF